MATEMVAEQSLPVELKKLSPVHKQVAALVAQGVDRRTIAAACDYTPEYVTWLQGQPLFREYIKHMNEAVSTRLEAMFDQSVTVISEAMVHGNTDEKLKGAKLQLEATGRVGRYQTTPPVVGAHDRLEQLSERLLKLLDKQRSTADGKVYEGETRDVSDAIVLGEEQKQLVQRQGFDESQPA